MNLKYIHTSTVDANLEDATEIFWLLTLVLTDTDDIERQSFARQHDHPLGVPEVVNVW